MTAGLEGFRQFEGATRVSYDADQESVRSAGREPSSALGKVWDWLTRSKAQVAANKETVQAFIAEVKNTYPEVATLATASLSGHLSKGKPLTGRRIQAVLDEVQRLQTQVQTQTQTQVQTKPQTQTQTQTQSTEQAQKKAQYAVSSEVNQALAGRGLTLALDTKISARTCGFDHSMLNNDEIASISAYTTSERLFGYSAMNGLLRDGDHSSHQSLKPAVVAATRGLEKLPDYRGDDGMVYRTVTAGPFLDAYTQDAVITELGFTSTHKLDHARRENLDPEKMNQTVLLIQGRHGKDIEGLSAYPKENEVLFKPLTRFVVTERSNNEHGQLLIRMRELEDDE